MARTGGSHPPNQGSIPCSATKRKYRTCSGIFFWLRGCGGEANGLKRGKCFAAAKHAAERPTVRASAGLAQPRATSPAAAGRGEMSVAGAIFCFAALTM